jgi:hypothetical protein
MPLFSWKPGEAGGYGIYVIAELLLPSPFESKLGCIVIGSKLYSSSTF